MTRLADLGKSLLADPEIRAEYDRLGPIFATVIEMVEARQKAGITRAELAGRTG